MSTPPSTTTIKNHLHPRSIRTCCGPDVSAVQSRAAGAVWSLDESVQCIFEVSDGSHRIVQLVEAEQADSETAEVLPQSAVADAGPAGFRQGQNRVQARISRKRRNSVQSPFCRPSWRGGILR